MQLGMIGLGRMGGNIVRRLMKNGHQLRRLRHRAPIPCEEFASEGAAPSKDLADFVKQLTAPRAVWVMLPAGQITEATITELSGLLASRRHRHRRRQFLLPGRHSPRRAAEAARASTMSMSAPAAACGVSSAAIA